MIIARSVIAVLAVLLGPIASASAGGQASATTELTGGRCRFIADDGEVGDYALKRCPGRGGASVYTEASPARVSLSFRWGKTRSADVVAGYSLGKTVEWRGLKKSGRFDPYAALVRVILRDDTVRDDGTFDTYNVLAIVRIAARAACLMAVIDEAANINAIVLARRTADADATAFACGKDRPKILGEPSLWAQKALGKPTG
jgi:hypothetical protein